MISYGDSLLWVLIFFLPFGVYCLIKWFLEILSASAIRKDKIDFSFEAVERLQKTIDRQGNKIIEHADLIWKLEERLGKKK